MLLFSGVMVAVSAVVTAGAVLPPEERPEIKALIIPGAVVETAVANSNGWVVLDYEKDIEKDSALDFSSWGLLDAPAGKYGRVVVRDGHFEFERLPGVRRRFYGANLCSSALFLADREIDQILTRFERLGYNTFRIHHYDRVIANPSLYATNKAYLPGIETNALERLDKLIAEAGRRGFYLSIDLFTVRDVKWRDCGIDREGGIPWRLYKLLLGIHNGVYADWEKFVRFAMGHCNPHNGLTWAEDPAVAFVSLVNEGVAPITNTMTDGISNEPILRRAWAEWLVKKRQHDSSYCPEAVTNSFPSGARCEAAVQFVSEVEARLAPRQAALLRQLGYTGLITSNNNRGRDFKPMQRVALDVYDYRDTHFYHDHCTTIGFSHPTTPPQRYPLTSPFTDLDLSLTEVAFERLPQLPFTITEFSFPVPSPTRAAGTLMAGAFASLQDWDGLWHFAYSHTRSTMQTGVGVPGHYDLAKDVLNQMAERLNIAVFLRGDVAPHADGLTLDLTNADWSNHPRGQSWKAAPSVILGQWSWGDAAWKAKVASSFGPVAGWRNVPRENAENPSGMAVLEELRENPQVRLVRKPADNPRWELVTERTCAGNSGRARDLVTVGPLSFRIGRAQGVVACTSLDDQPLAKSKRILLVHLTDVIGEGARKVAAIPMNQNGRMVPTYIQLGWGNGRTLVKDGYADIDLALEQPSAYRVYALATSGRRLAEVLTKVVGGKLHFRACVSGSDGKGRLAYEILRD